MDLKFEIKYWFSNQRDKLEYAYYRLKYSDYMEKYMQGKLICDLEFIWGIKAGDELCKGDASFHMMNDIEILYNRETKEYHLGVETIYGFKTKKDKIDYYLELLGYFKEYMIKNNLDISTSIFSNAQMTGYFNFKADSIEDLYSVFRINVLGYIEVLLNND